MTKTKIVEPHRTFWVESFETQPQLNEGGDKGPQCVETESRAAVTATLTEKCELKPRNEKSSLLTIVYRMQHNFLCLCVPIKYNFLNALRKYG